MSRPELNSAVTVIPQTKFIFCIILSTLSVTNCTKNDIMDYTHAKCQKIHVSTCQGLPYNETSFPNSLDQQTQDEAALEMHQFLPLIKIKCSSNFNLFVCSVYLPVCNGSYGVIAPCRSLCQEARQGCERILKQFNFAWPDHFNCDKFPATGNCVSEHSLNCHEACISGKAQIFSSSQVTTTQMSNTRRTNQGGISENSSTNSPVVDLVVLLSATCFLTCIGALL
ncbi:unnamed protein product [Lymnaea stagnalis]|uniref:FZ domain-containing protein n=1 Tax=Lymnaea stagnalis TaxID=6523 RepID=A0AAV2HIN2_LYMST